MILRARWRHERVLLLLEVIRGWHLLRLWWRLLLLKGRHDMWLHSIRRWGHLVHERSRLHHLRWRRLHRRRHHLTRKLLLPRVNGKLLTHDHVCLRLRLLRWGIILSYNRHHRVSLNWRLSNVESRWIIRIKIGKLLLELSTLNFLNQLSGWTMTIWILSNL